MRVLITGATGFVGRHLATLLLSRRHEVFGTVLQPEGDGQDDKIRLLSCDMRDAQQVRSAVEDARPDQVYHLAGLSSVRESFEDARAVYETNFFGALHLLDAVRRTNASARVLLIGSGHCYGKLRPRELPATEQQVLAPNSPYAVSKAAADLLGRHYFESFGLHVIRARPFNHTGPGQSTHFVCSDFARQFAAIELNLAAPVLRVGNLHARRDFSDVRDIVRAYVLLLQKGKPGEAYNVGSGRAVSLDEVLKILRSFCTRSIAIQTEETRFRRGEADVLYGSSRKLKQATGWRPEYDLKSTLRDLYCYWIAILTRQLGEHEAAGVGKS